MKRSKTYGNGLHKYEIINIEKNMKIDTNEFADIHGVKLEEVPYIDKWPDYATLCKPDHTIYWCQILTFLKY